MFVRSLSLGSSFRRGLAYGVASLVFQRRVFFPWVVLFLCCAFGRLSIFDLEAGARTGLNANAPAGTAGIGNLALRARARRL